MLINIPGLIDAPASPDTRRLSLSRGKKPGIAGRQVFFAGIAVKCRFLQ
jgi:hypothetical protein